MNAPEPHDRQSGHPKAGLSSTSRRIRIISRFARGYAPAVPAMVGLGLGASLAESLAVGLVVVFLYAAIGPGAEAAGLSGWLTYLFGTVAALDAGSLPVLGGLIVGLVIAKAALNFAYDLLTAVIKNTISERARNAIYAQFLEVSYGSVQRHDKGELLNVLARDSWAVAEAFYCMARMGTNLVALFVFGILLFAISWQMALITAAGTIILLVCVHALSTPTRRLGAAAQEASRELAIQGVNTLAVLRSIRAYAQEDFRKSHFNAASRHACRTLVRLEAIHSAARPITELVYVVLLAATLWTAAFLEVAFASILTATGLLYRLQPHIREFERNRLMLAGLDASLEAVDGLVRSEDKLYPPQGSRIFAGLKQAIRFERVSLTYPGSETPALDEASFLIPWGQTTAIVGPSGAGKTTVVNLLLRLYEPDRGFILLDGVRLDEFERTSWLARIALAGQDAELIEETIIGNLQLANPEAGPTDIVEAVRIAGISDFISGLPEGYDSWIGEQGLNLSGGQRQRIGLARAMIRRPELLILDEATNAIEEDLEAEIRASVGTVMRERTTIIITHRMENLRDVDHVVHLRNGRVLQQGPPEVVLGAKRRFSYEPTTVTS